MRKFLGGNRRGYTDFIGETGRIAVAKDGQVVILDFFALETAIFSVTKGQDFIPAHFFRTTPAYEAAILPVHAASKKGVRAASISAHAGPCGITGLSFLILRLATTTNNFQTIPPDSLKFRQ